MSLSFDFFVSLLATILVGLFAFFSTKFLDEKKRLGRKKKEINKIE